MPQNDLRRSLELLYQQEALFFSTAACYLNHYLDVFLCPKKPSYRQWVTQVVVMSLLARARLSNNVGGSTRPDLSAPCQLLASAVAKEHPDEATYKSLNKLVDIAHNTASDRLTFVPLNPETLRVVLHTDTSFANADGMKSQLGFVIMLVDGKNNANIVHYASRRCTRVTRSVLAAELYALVLGFDHSVLVREICTEILERAVSIDGMIDSQTLFDIVTRLSSPTSIRLGIDIYSL
jgi:hypothetical protein